MVVLVLQNIKKSVGKWRLNAGLSGVYRNIMGIQIALTHGCRVRKHWFHMFTWRFPEMGVPPNHPVSYDFALKKSSIWGYHHVYGNPHKGPKFKLNEAVGTHCTSRGAPATNLGPERSDRESVCYQDAACT